HLPVNIREGQWDNLVRVISAYLPGNMKSGLLEVDIGGEHRSVTLARNGYFHLRFNGIHVPNGVPEPRYHFFRKNIMHNVHIPEHYSRSISHFKEFSTGIVSDIDDTILVSHTRNWMKKLRQLLAKNAYRRKAVTEMASLYQKMKKRNMHLFYVSNSEANLYPMIHLFLHYHGFPEGPVFLKPYKKWNEILSKETPNTRSRHKIEKIEGIFSLFRNNNFILIGDDSRRDPEIYWKIARENPGRVSCIFIRQTGKTPSLRARKTSDEIGKNPLTKFVYFRSPAALEEIIEDGDLLK
ncbi:MAG TPA: App1 family protein, partial [Cyclobacteriaceae bacterium]|nr:App1 family protein [Cyclobacteriaceae bacterium]